jgi:hypothetical protein
MVAPHPFITRAIAATVALKFSCATPWTSFVP